MINIIYNKLKLCYLIIQYLPKFIKLVIHGAIVWDVIPDRLNRKTIYEDWFNAIRATPLYIEANKLDEMRNKILNAKY